MISISEKRFFKFNGLILAILVFTAIAPVVLLCGPVIASQLGHQLHLGAGSIGNLFAVELGGMSVATLPAYWWLPRFSWRRVALLAVFLFIVANLGSVLVIGDYYGLMACRGVSGLAGGSLMVLSLSAASCLRNKGRVYGLWVLGQLVLGAIGLWLLPGLFGHFGLAICYWLLAGLMIVTSPLAWAFSSSPMFSTSTLRARPVRHRLEFGLGMLVVLTFYIGLSGIWTFIGAIAVHAGLAASYSGKVLAVATILGIVGALGATLIGNRGSRQALLLTSYLLMIVSICMLYGNPDILRFVAAAFIFKFVWTFGLPYILATLAELDESGQLMNSINLMIGGGLAVGPALAGWIIGMSGDFDSMIIVEAVIVLVPHFISILG